MGKKKSIIIGANGYLGRNIAHYLTGKGEEVTCYDIHDSAYDNVNNYSTLDITNAEEVCRINLDVDFIYMFAGATGTWQGFEQYEKYIDVNEKGLINLVDCLVKKNSKAKIIFPSTRLVYKGKDGVELEETAEKECKTIYAVNKLACENILNLYKNAFGINYTIFRICVPYGNLVDGEFSYGTIGFFISYAQKGESIILYGDGRHKRTFTFVGDICAKIYKTIEKEETNGEIYNIGGENLSLLDAAKKIARKFGVDIKFDTWPDLALKLETGDTIFNSRKLDDLIRDKTSEYTIDKWLQAL